MSTELVVTYSSLGTREDDDYYKGEECHACIKDLIRALRSDDDCCSIRRALGRACVLQTDLVGLLVYHHDDIPLRNDVIRLLVNLTQPAILCFKDAKERKDSEFTKSYLEVIGYLQSYKEEFVDTRLMNVFGSVLAELCQKEWEDRDDDDIIIIERILLLIRNILHITIDPSIEKRTDNDASLHDQVILNLHKNGMDELLLFLGSNPNETEWCMHILEILFLLLKEQSPKQLVECGQRPLEEKEKDERMIDEILMKENTRESKVHSLGGSRHSRFGGSYYVVPKLPGRTRIHHKPLAGVNDYSYDTEKKPRRTPHTRRPAAAPVKARSSTYSIRMVLKEFCIQVMDYCFNPLMKVVKARAALLEGCMTKCNLSFQEKDAIKRQRSMENDETYYLWAIRFFMEFSRLNNFRVDIVSETLQLSTLRDVIHLIADYYEHLFMNKRDRTEALSWSQRLHYGVNAYKELLLHIRSMTQSKDPVIVESSKVILGNILYHVEYRDVFVLLLRNYREPLQPVVFLQDVILMTHTYIHLMDGYCRKAGNVMIQKKRKVKKKKNAIGSQEFGEVLADEGKLARWEELKEHVTECVREQSDVVPYIVNEDVPMEEQRLEVMGRIYGSLCKVDVSAAVMLMRKAREIWQDGVFGAEGATNEDELQCLHDLFFSSTAATFANRQVEDDNDDDNEEYESQPTVQEYELEFDFNKLTSTFTNNKIVCAYCCILKTYSINSEDLNHAIVKMLHQVAVKHKMAAMLYQISVFRTMLSILQEPPVPRFKELQEFSCFIVNGFFKMSKTNPVAFVELMFWKTSGECYELVEGYGTLARERELIKNKTIFTREQDEELAELYDRFKDENDIVGCIVAALPTELGRTRKIIASQIVSQGLVSNRKALQRKPTKNKKTWTEEETYTLQSVWQPGENAEESIKQLLHYFPEHGVSSIKKQLYSLGLLARKGNKRKGLSESNIDEDDDNDDIPSSNVQNEELSIDLPVNTVHPSTATVSGSKKGIDSTVQRLIQKGYSSQLVWLSEYLINEAEDRELDSEWEDMCLAPQQESQSIAINTQLFKDLLVSIGLDPPGNQVYWRIPKTILPKNLRSVALKLTPSHINEAGLEDGYSQSQDLNNEDESANDSDDNEDLSRGEILNKLQQKRLANKRKFEGKQNNDENVEESEEITELAGHRNDSESTNKKLKKHFLSDDESDNSDGELIIATDTDSNTITHSKTTPHSLHRRFLNDSDED